MCDEIVRCREMFFASDLAVQSIKRAPKTLDISELCLMHRTPRMPGLELSTFLGRHEAGMDTKNPCVGFIPCARVMLGGGVLYRHIRLIVWQRVRQILENHSMVARNVVPTQ